MIPYSREDLEVPYTVSLAIADIFMIQTRSSPPMQLLELSSMAPTSNSTSTYILSLSMHSLLTQITQDGRLHLLQLGSVLGAFTTTGPMAYRWITLNTMGG
jgi:hypothetical protein